MSSEHKGRENLLNQSITGYNSRKNTPSLYRYEVPNGKEFKNSEFGSEIYQIRPEAKRCRQPKGPIDSKNEL